MSMVNGEEVHAGGGVPFGLELMKFAESLATGDTSALVSSRQALLDAAGPSMLVDAAGVAANFQRMVRIADATAIPADNIISALTEDLREELDLDRFHSAQNTPKPNFIQRLQGIFIRALAPFLMRRMARKNSG